MMEDAEYDHELDAAIRVASKLKPLSDFVAEYEPVSWVIEPVIQAGRTYTLTALTGDGKTGWAIITSLAVAAGRQDLIGAPVEQGRVAFLAFEDADGTRMRMKSACHMLGIDPASISADLRILDELVSPEGALMMLKALSFRTPLRLVIVDTFQSGFSFDGDDPNSASQAGGYLRRLRPLTKLKGRPAVIVLAHPKKDASRDDLKPYGSGAVLNEVDGALCLSQDGNGVVKLGWHGKLRSKSFDPITYRFFDSSSDAVLDAKGRQVPLTTLKPIKVVPAPQAEPKAPGKTKDLPALLRAMLADPSGSMLSWGESLGKPKSTVHSWLNDAVEHRLVIKTGSRYLPTPLGVMQAETPKSALA